METVDQLLDRIDVSRFDVAAIVDRLNEFRDLPAEVQDDEEFGCRGYAGLDEAEHALTALCGDSDNDKSIVRALDGELYLVFETDIRLGTWSSGRLTGAHVSELELDSCQSDEFAPVEEHGIPLTPDELDFVLDSL